RAQPFNCFSRLFVLICKEKSLFKNPLHYFFIFCISFVPNLVFAQLDFVENKGQWHPNIKYKTDFNTGSFYLEEQGFTVQLHKPEDLSDLSEITHGHGKKRFDF